MATSQPLQLYPAWLNLKGQKVLLAGGGQVALRRATTLLSHRARLRVAAPEVLPLFERWEAEKRIQLFRRVFKESDLDGARLAFACTDDPQVNQQIVNSALSMGIWVESCTRAEGANVYPGGVIHSGPIALAISSMGKSPIVTQALRECFEEVFGADWGDEIDQLISEAGDEGGSHRISPEELKRKVRESVFMQVKRWGERKTTS